MHKAQLALDSLKEVILRYPISHFRPSGFRCTTHSNGLDDAHESSRHDPPLTGTWFREALGFPEAPALSSRIKQSLLIGQEGSREQKMETVPSSDVSGHSCWEWTTLTPGLMARRPQTGIYSPVAFNVLLDTNDREVGKIHQNNCDTLQVSSRCEGKS